MPLYTPFWMTVSAPPESRHTSGLLNVNSLLLRIQNVPHRTVFSEPLITLIPSPADTDTFPNPWISVSELAPHLCYLW